MEPIVNKVAESGLLTLDLAPYVPVPDSMIDFDLKPFLFKEMILKEKDFRAALQLFDWQPFTHKNVAVYCSADAIIPVWAYMLVTSYLEPIADIVYFGTVNEMATAIIRSNIEAIDAGTYEGKRVVIKGCGDTHVPEAAYVAITQLLVGRVRSLMYGEPCSTVPIYKKANTTTTTM